MKGISFKTKKLTALIFRRFFDEQKFLIFLPKIFLRSKALNNICLQKYLRKNFLKNFLSIDSCFSNVVGSYFLSKQEFLRFFNNHQSSILFLKYNSVFWCCPLFLIQQKFLISLAKLQFFFFFKKTFAAVCFVYIFFCKELVNLYMLCFCLFL